MLAPHCGDHLVRVAIDPDRRKDARDASRAIDHEGGTPRDAIDERHSEGSSQSPLWVGHEREGKSVVLRKGAVRFDRVSAHAYDVDTGLGVYPCLVAEGLCLTRAAWRLVARIEVHHQRARARPGTEIDGPAVVRKGVDARCRIPLSEQSAARR